MPRLIDADVLTSILEDWEEKACDGTENDGSDGTTRVLHPVPTTMREVIDLIADQPTISPAPQWIPVMERLPIQGETVFAWAAPFVSKAWRNEKGDWVTTNGPAASLKPVTHWMPLPEPPKMDGGADNAAEE